MIFIQWYFLFPAYEQRLSGNSSKNGRIDPILTKFFGLIFFFFTKKYKKQRKSNIFRVNLTMLSQLNPISYLINTNFGEKWLKSVQWSVLPNESRWEKTTWHPGWVWGVAITRGEGVEVRTLWGKLWFFPRIFTDEIKCLMLANTSLYQMNLIQLKR